MSDTPVTTSERRASDNDRDAVVEALRGHHAAGRLNTEELDERLHAALAARTVPELKVQLVDLPATALARSARRHAPRWARPALLVAGCATVALSGITDANFIWLVWPLFWFARPWRWRQGTGLSSTVVI